MKSIRFIVGFATCMLLLIQATAQQVTIAEAEKVAASVMNYENVDTVLIDTVFAMVENGDTLLFEVYFEGGESVLLSGNKMCMPVLGLLFPADVDERMRLSSFDFDNESLPNGYKNLIEGYASQIRYCFQNDTVYSIYQGAWMNLLQNDETNDGGDKGVGPLVSTKWGQHSSNEILESFRDGHAYNYYVSQQNILCEGGYCPAGCVSVAMAQIMKKWDYPDDIPYGCHQFQWSKMPNKLINVFNSDYSDERDEVAGIIHESAESVGMEYCVEGDCFSGIRVEDFGKIEMAFRNQFGYSDAHGEIRRNRLNDWENMLITDLDNDSPVFYTGGGHAFVCDGYKQRPIYGGYKFHFNWGWKGKKNGWYTIDDLTPRPYNFNSDERAVFHIRPTDCWVNIIMQCNKAFAEDEYKYYSAQNSFSNNYHNYVINSGASVHLQAGEEILLTEGFYAVEGSEFTAIIAPCGNSRGNGGCLSELSDENVQQEQEIERTNQTYSSVSSSEMLIFPNPVAGTFSIRLGNSSENVTSVEVFNMVGGMVLRQDNIQDNIDVSSLHKGMYLVRVKCGSGEVCYGKFIKEE